jgi:hypothetical protein
MSSFSWLHLTDLHWGMSGHRWLWPNLREKFYEDLERLSQLCGPWDLVLFTGDLVQSGEAEEFHRLSSFFRELWDRFRDLQSAPLLLAVPGNHDLVRPDPKLPEMVVLTYWDTHPDIRRQFWDDAGSPYRKIVDNAFANYLNWWNSCQLRGSIDYRPGVMPGDFSATFEKEGYKLGIVGLNTTFLQLKGGDYEEKLDLDVRQFHEACGGDGPKWVNEHDFCMLLTHHPPQWLRPNQNNAGVLNQNYLEIAPPGRFALHLFGHMHVPLAIVEERGSAAARRLWQGASLFGLDSWGEGEVQERLHGYSAGRIEQKDSSWVLRFWPREARVQMSGDRNIVPDYRYVLDHDQCTAVAPLMSRRPQVRQTRHLTRQVAIDPDLEKRARGGDPQAMVELSISGSPAAFDVLSGVLKTSSKDKTREDAVHAISNLTDDRKIRLLGDILVTEKWLVAAACAEALGRCGNNAAIPYLIKALRLRVDWLVAQKSAEALGFLEPTEEALQTLVKSLNEGSFEGEAAKQSLVKHGEASVPVLLNNLAEEKDYTGLLFTIQTLEIIGDKRVIPELRKVQRKIDKLRFETNFGFFPFGWSSVPPTSEERQAQSKEREAQLKRNLKTSAADAIKSIQLVCRL